MKKGIKFFEEFINENMGRNPESVVIISLGNNELEDWGITMSKLGQIAPNCEFLKFELANMDYWDITIAGPKIQCQAIADYMNELSGEFGTGVQVFPFHRNSRY